MQRPAKAQQEPQSEAEESKEESNFTQNVIKEVDKFLDALRSNAIVNEADIENLKSSRTLQYAQIELLGKFKELCQGSIQEVIAKMSKQIEVLEKEVAANHKIADLVLIEIKAIFAKSLVKIQFLPEVIQATPQQHLEPIKQFK